MSRKIKNISINDDNNLIESIVKNTCLLKNITLKELGEKANLTENTLQVIFKRNSANMKSLKSIANALDLDVSLFFKNEEKVKDVLEYRNAGLGQRIEDLIYNLRLSQKDFAKNIGIIESRLTQIIKGKNNPNVDFIEAIGKAYPEINFDWLLLGKGNKWKDKETLTTLNEPETEYKIKCKQCEMYERIIEAKDELIENLKTNEESKNKNVG